MIEKYREELRKNGSIAAISAIFAWLVIGLVFEEMLFSFFYGLLFGVAVFAFLLHLPKIRRKLFARQIEGEMPLALMSIAAELNMNISFEKSIENAGKGNGKIAKEFRQILREYREHGASLQQSLFNFAERTDSLNVKRCVAQLVNVLEQGKRRRKGAPIKRIAREMLARQKAQIREYNGKIVFFSVIFIVVSAIVPAMFQSFIIVGSMVLKLEFTPMQVLLIVAAIFPVIDLLVLLYIKSKAPVFLEA